MVGLEVEVSREISNAAAEICGERIDARRPIGGRSRLRRSAPDDLVEVLARILAQWNERNAANATGLARFIVYDHVCAQQRGLAIPQDRVRPNLAARVARERDLGDLHRQVRPVVRRWNHAGDDLNARVEKRGMDGEPVVSASLRGKLDLAHGLALADRDAAHSAQALTECEASRTKRIVVLLVR